MAKSSADYYATSRLSFGKTDITVFWSYLILPPLAFGAVRLAPLWHEHLFTAAASHHVPEGARPSFVGGSWLCA